MVSAVSVPAQVLLRACLHYSGSGRHADALLCLDESLPMLRVKAQRAAVRRYRSRLLLKLGRLREARREAHLAVAEDGTRTNALSLHLLGLVELQCGNVHTALRTLGTVADEYSIQDERSGRNDVDAGSERESERDVYGTDDKDYTYALTHALVLQAQCKLRVNDFQGALSDVERCSQLLDATHHWQPAMQKTREFCIARVAADRAIPTHCIAMLVDEDTMDTATSTSTDLI
jgi:tetratricopeptide (TPR) repeat protein